MNLLFPHRIRQIWAWMTVKHRAQARSEAQLPIPDIRARPWYYWCCVSGWCWIGLSNPGTFRVGDAPTTGENSIPSIPEICAGNFCAGVAEIGSYSRFLKGIDQLGEEGVIQIFSGCLASPTPLGGGGWIAVVFQSRMESEVQRNVTLERLPIAHAVVGGNIMPSGAIPVRMMVEIVRWRCSRLIGT